MRFELLYAKHGPAVKAYVLRRARASVADDVVADVFVVCWRRFEEVPPDPLPWLLGVARRVLSTQLRGDRRRVALRDRLAEAAAGADAETPADPVLAAAFSRLSQAERELLLLIAWEDLSPSEAATVLGIKPATARVRLLRARRRLSGAIARERSDPTKCQPLSMEAPS